MGASSGIGLRIAEEFAKRGITVGLAARHTKELKKLNEKYPKNVKYKSIDITHKDAPVHLTELINEIGGMDTYLHISGIGYDNPDLNPERDADIVTTNAVGFARMACSAYKYFRTNKIKGRIAGITSVAGTNGIGKLAAYSASKKFAQTYLTALQQLSYDENSGIKITDIRPGWIRTPLLYNDIKYPLEMDIEYATPLIIKAIVKAPKVAYIDWKWGIICNLWKLIPNHIWTQMKTNLFIP